MLILPRYILRHHIGPFIFGNLVIIFIFLTNWLLHNLYKIVGKGLSYHVIIEMIALNLAWIATLSIPMSVLIATLTVFGKLAQENEVTAMRAGGISTVRLLLSPFLASILLMFIMINFNNTVLPWANHRLKNLMTDVYRKKPALNFQNGTFTNQIPDYHLLIKRIDPHSPKIFGITIFDYSQPGIKRAIVADHGSFKFAESADRLLLTLYDGEVHDLQRPDPEQYQRMQFHRHLVSIPMEGLSFKRTRSGHYSDREMSAQMMRDAINNLMEEISNRKESLRQFLRIPGTLTVDRIARIADSLQYRLQLTQQALSGAIGVNNRQLVDSLRVALKRSSTKHENVRRELAIIRARLRTIDAYALEIQKKYSIPAACIVFVLIGGPIGLLMQRGSLAMGGGTGLMFFILYWAFLIAGEDLSDRGFINPFFAMWLPNILIGIAGMVLTYRVITERSFTFKRLKRIKQFFQNL